MRARASCRSRPYSPDLCSQPRRATRTIRTVARCYRLLRLRRALIGAGLARAVVVGPEPGPDGSSPSAVGAAGERSEDGKWFQSIDERYLLPLFSNATASRTFYAKRTRRAPGRWSRGKRRKRRDKSWTLVVGARPRPLISRGLGSEWMRVVSSADCRVRYCGGRAILL
jgi:hypothetical protein